MQREEAILSSLKKLDYMSRSQIQRLHNLGGDRNARRVLDNLSSYLSCFRGDNGENIYHLNKEGRNRINCEVVRQKTAQAGHYLMRAGAYIHYGGGEDWKNEMNFKIEGVVNLITDSYFRYNGRRHFLEVDRLQHMAKNHEKITRYKKLHATGTLQEKLKYFPRIVWVTLTESRKAQLLEWCAGMDVIVHVWNDIE